MCFFQKIAYFKKLLILKSAYYGLFQKMAYFKIWLISKNGLFQKMAYLFHYFYQNFSNFFSKYNLTCARRVRSGAPNSWFFAFFANFSELLPFETLDTPLPIFEMELFLHFLHHFFL